MPPSIFCKSAILTHISHNLKIIEVMSSHAPKHSGGGLQYTTFLMEGGGNSSTIYLGNCKDIDRIKI